MVRNERTRIAGKKRKTVRPLSMHVTAIAKLFDINIPLENRTNAGCALIRRVRDPATTMRGFQLFHIACAVHTIMILYNNYFSATTSKSRTFAAVKVSFGFGLRVWSSYRENLDGPLEIGTGQLL